MRAAAASTSRPAPVAGDVLVHPLVVGALALLILNDHVLKAVAPGAITGKLSDFAGLAFFPAFLLAAWELLLRSTHRWSRPSLAALGVAIAVTAVGFALVKTVAPVAEAAGWVLGAAQWAISIGPRLLGGAPAAGIRPATIVVDPTDLIALFALAMPIWVGLRRAVQPEPSQPGPLDVARTS